MSAQPTDREWFNDTVARNAGLLSAGNSPWLDASREEARQAIAEIVMPNRKQEAWRYSDLGHLYKQSYRYLDVPHEKVETPDASDWVYPYEDAYRLVFINSRFEPSLSFEGGMPDGVSIGSLHEAMTTDPALLTRWLKEESSYTPDAFSELNRALFDDGLFIHLRENAEVDKPVEVLYLNVSSEHHALSQPRSQVILEAGARMELIEHYTSTTESDYFLNGLTEIYLGADANLQHYRLQNEARDAHHLSRISLRQGRGSAYRGLNIATGAAWGRTDIVTRFEGEHAVCDLEGLYTVGEKQYTDFHLDVRHSLPNCRSSENFRGIVFGKGRAVFDGRILVEKDAQKTDAHLTNKNLVLEKNAEVDTKPQLEIHADDVKCSHGTTVGRIDPNQLFYLRSRGIDESQARKMLCLGFAEQVLENVEDEAIHAFIHAQIAELFEREPALS